MRGCESQGNSGEEPHVSAQTHENTEVPRSIVVLMVWSNRRTVRGRQSAMITRAEDNGSSEKGVALMART